MSEFILAVFFVNHRSTTEIDTYCHTLPLQCALPISLPNSPAGRKSRMMMSSEKLNSSLSEGLRNTAPSDSAIETSKIGRAKSEIHSLMRISYAAIGLEKKHGKIGTLNSKSQMQRGIKKVIETSTTNTQRTNVE